MAEYLYLPVPSAEMLSFAETFNKARVHAKKRPLTVLHNRYLSGRGKGFMRAIGLGCLRNVTATDTLYLVLHGTGDVSSRTVGADRLLRPNSAGKFERAAGAAVDMKVYTPGDIARVLAAEDLPRTFRDLHLLTCGSGLMGFKGTQRDDVLYRKSFAQRVWEAMRASGYNFIKVTGYLGDVSFGVGDGRGFGVTVYEDGGRADKEVGVEDGGWSVTYG